MTLREHNRWIVKVHLQHGAEGKIVTARYACMETCADRKGWGRHVNSGENILVFKLDSILKIRTKNGNYLRNY